ncbi:MAG: metal ABC transporter permease [Acidimicrobiia bacterium]|nr:metal ABC transporter permease [Acidimicrobiia bacterium]
MEWLTDPFRLGFMQEALKASLLAVVVCSMVGTWVVLRGLAFIGDALAHGVIPGVALAQLLGFSLVLGAVGSALVMAAGVTLVNRRSRVGEDAAIGLLFVGMLAVGVIIISGSSSRDLTTVLFGSILAVSSSDVVLLVAATVVIGVASLVLHRPLLALAFNAEKAAALGMRPGLTHAALMVMVTIAVVTSFQAVGTLMVFALIVAPPATAALFARRVTTVLVGGVVAGWVAALAGLLLSFHAGTAGGASIAACTVGLFFVALGAKEATEALRNHRRPAPMPA